MQLTLEIDCLILLITTVIYTGYMYNQLPDQIATHFGFDGTADAWGSKNTIWFCPAIVLGLYVLLTVLYFFPQSYNMPVKVTAENQEQLYRMTDRKSVV